MRPDTTSGRAAGGVLAGVRSLAASGAATAVWSAQLPERAARRGLRVVNINPGLVRTRITRTWPRPLRVLNQMLTAVAGAPAEDIADDIIALVTAALVPAAIDDPARSSAGAQHLPPPAALHRFHRGGRPVAVPAAVYDPALGDQVWALSQGLTAPVRQNITSTGRR